MFDTGQSAMERWSEQIQLTNQLCLSSHTRKPYNSPEFQFVKYNAPPQAFMYMFIHFTWDKNRETCRLITIKTSNVVEICQCPPKPLLLFFGGINFGCISYPPLQWGAGICSGSVDGMLGSGVHHFQACLIKPLMRAPLNPSPARCDTPRPTHTLEAMCWT